MTFSSRYYPYVYAALAMLALIAFFLAVAYFDNKSDTAAYARNVANVRHFCGAEKAEAFKATHSSGYPWNGETAEWIKECVDK